MRRPGEQSPCAQKNGPRGYDGRVQRAGGGGRSSDMPLKTKEGGNGMGVAGLITEPSSWREVGKGKRNGGGLKGGEGGINLLPTPTFVSINTTR